MRRRENTIRIMSIMSMIKLIIENKDKDKKKYKDNNNYKDNKYNYSNYN